MAIFTVDNNNDSGLGSLRQAIADANAALGLDTIEFDNSLSGQTITLTSGELQITDDLTINGLGANLLTISGNNTNRVFLVSDGNNSNDLDVTLDSLTITEGTATDVFTGGGISNEENLTILNSIISDNAGNGISSQTAGTTNGGLTIANSIISDNNGTGINGNRLEITGSTISGNTANGIGVFTGSLILTDSTISNNAATGINGNRADYEIDNSTISDNLEGINGFLVFGGTISNSRITNNTSVGVSGLGVDLEFENTILAGNFDDISSSRLGSGLSLISNGYNFIGEFPDVDVPNPFTEIGDLVGTIDNPLDLTNIIEGTSGNDSLAGTSARNRLEGGNGNDTLSGRGDIDLLLGEDGDDSLLGGNGDDTLDGGVGDDILNGQADNDLLFGDDGNDTLNGGAGDDQLFGEADDDRLTGGNGNDTLDGGTDADQLFGNNDHDLLFGRAGNDTLNGGAGNDQLFGGADDDRLTGGDGDDTLNGGIGRDLLFGGAGSDRFALVSGVTGDRDTIRDYEDGIDRLILTGDLSFNDLTIAQIGANTRIRETATNQTLAILSGIDVNNINQLDFEFGGIRVEAEDYVDFSDTTAGNTGGFYRSDDVDIEETTDLGEGFNVGYIAEGEWLTYNVNLAESDLYQVVARVASNTTDGRIHHLDVSLDGQSTSLEFGATGGWQSWTDVIGDNLNLSAGSHELRFDMGSAGFNINYVDLIPLNPVRIEAEDYKDYYDTTAGNTGGEYRNDDVDIEVTTDIGGGFNVGYIADGEWLTYDVDIPESGLYQVAARVASNTTDGRVHNLDVSLGGEVISLGFDATGGWQSWTDVIGDSVNLSAGSYEMRLDMGSSGFNVNYVDLIPVDL